MEPLRTRFKAMGCPCEIRVHPASGTDAGAALAAGRAEVERLERKYTRYRDDSVTAAINRSAGSDLGIDVDSETAALLDYADTAWRESGGRFDPTSGALRTVWDFRSGRVPSRAQVAAVLEQIGWQRVAWERPRLVLPRPEMQLDFGGFVKEYAADRVAGELRARGLHHGLVDLGGDLAVVGPHPDGSPWRVGIRDPHRPGRAVAAVALWSGGIATSGDYERGLHVAGRRYGHILDPTTGWPVDGLASVSVVASHCLVAGTAATVAMLHGRQGGAWLRDLSLPHLVVSPEGRCSGPLARRELSAPCEGAAAAAARRGSPAARPPGNRAGAKPSAPGRSSCPARSARVGSARGTPRS